MCGKDCQLNGLYRSKPGSPPRVREGLIDRLATGEEIRITPACAGRTSLMLFHVFQSRDHPRVCGKDLVAKDTQVSDVGSPPRVREGLDLSQYPQNSSGITPACAGRTRLSICTNPRLWDHPRVCGKDHFL